MSGLNIRITDKHISVVGTFDELQSVASGAPVLIDVQSRDYGLTDHLQSRDALIGLLLRSAPLWRPLDRAVIASAGHSPELPAWQNSAGGATLARPDTVGGYL